jgi:hypothetical protein
MSLDVNPALRAEQSSWKVPETKSGKLLEIIVVKTDQELIDLFPDDLEITRVKDMDFVYFTYQDEDHIKKKLAYNCPFCKKIFIRAPRIKYVDDIKGMTGSQRLEFYCQGIFCSILGKQPLIHTEYIAFS